MKQNFRKRYLDNARAFNHALFHARQAVSNRKNSKQLLRRLELIEGYTSYRVDQIEFWCGLAELPLIAPLCHSPIKSHEAHLQRTINELETVTTQQL